MKVTTFIDRAEDGDVFAATDEHGIAHAYAVRLGYDPRFYALDAFCDDGPVSLINHATQHIAPTVTCLACLVHEGDWLFALERDPVEAE